MLNRRWRALVLVLGGALAGAALVSALWALDGGEERVEGAGKVRVSVEPGPPALEAIGRSAVEEAAHTVNRDFALPEDLHMSVIGAATAAKLDVDGPEYSPKANTLYVPWDFLRHARSDLRAGSEAPQVAAPYDRVLLYAIEFIVYHELAHGLIDLLELPIVGKEENAADSLAAILAFSSGRLGATVVLAGGDLFEAEAEHQVESVELTSAQFYDLNRQRYDQMLCLAYGSDPAHHASLLGSVRGLPASAGDVCKFEYHRQRRSWLQLTEPWLRPSALELLPAQGDHESRIQKDPANADTTITIASKDFTDERVLAEIYAQGLEAAGYTVRRKLGLGDERAALRALEAGDADAYPEYTGTALLSFFGQDASEIAKDPTVAYEAARDGFRRKGLVAHAPAPFQSSNAVGLTARSARKLGVEKISDLARHDQDLALYGSRGCIRRTDCLRGLQDVYGLRFKRFVPIPIDDRTEVLTSGRAELSIVFTTDPEVTREGLVLLKDDKHMLPPYNPTLVVREEVATPELAEVVELIQSQLAEEVLQELYARVSIDGETPAQAAAEYFEESGLF